MTQSSPIPVFSLYGETDDVPDVIHCETLSVRAPIHEWRISPHRHAQFAQLFLFTSGQIDVIADDMKQTLSAGAFFFAPMLCVHSFRFEPGTEGQVFSLPVNVLNAAGQATPELRSALAKPVAGRVTSVLGAQCALLAEICEGRSPFRTHLAMTMAQTVLGLVAGTHRQDPDVWHPVRAVQPQERMDRFDTMIRMHLSDRWTASDYASELAMSPGHLSRLCRASTGMGATAYIEQARMAEAQRMLAFTQLPVAEVGFRLGYSDPSYFTRRFQKTTGNTPRAYRARFTRQG
ncbi:MAG: helix-turn-helix domain-containing protein [Paracoccaceae bacterium]